MPDCRTSNPCFTFPRNTQNASITFMDGTPDYLHHPSVNTVPSALYLKVYTPGRGRNRALTFCAPLRSQLAALPAPSQMPS